MKTDKVQHYLNNFRRELSVYLKPDYNVKAIIFPSEEGTIIEFEFRKDQPTRDEFRKMEQTIIDHLHKINVKSLNDHTTNLKFSGTNMYLEPGKIFLIKDNNDSEWTSEKAHDDVEKLINPQNAV